MGRSASSIGDDAVVVDRDDISNYNPEQILPESPDEIKKIRVWLKPTDYSLESGEFRKHLTSYLPGTGNWFTSSTTYREWLEGDEHGLLWIKGIPGSGKSVAAAHLVDELSQSNPTSPVLYFFFRHIIDANHEPAALLRDWLDQVLEYSPPLQKQLKELVNTQRSISSMSMDDLWKNLRLAFAGLPGKAFCIADAFDEMDQGNDNFIRAFAALGQWRPGKVKVLITSRPVPSVEVPLRNAQMLHIRLAEDMVDNDISSYVEHSLRSSSISSSDQNLIREAVPGRASGLFLYAKLAMDAFLEPGAHARIHDVLRTLPTDLHDMYTKLLHEHALRSGVPDDIQLLILQWATHATRPLRLLEVAEMINVTYPSEVKRDLRATKDLVRAAAGPLLEILPNETICVIHHSLTEYLKCATRSENDGGYPILRLGSTHGRLALVCLAYLQSGCLDQISVPDGEPSDSGGELDFEAQGSDDYGRSSRRYPMNKREQQQLRLKYPFLEYAAANWHVHVGRSAAAGYPQGDINADLDQLFGNAQRTQAWLKMQWSDEGDYLGITPLHIAARYGLTDYAILLVANTSADIHTGDVYGKTPLWWSAACGHADLIRVLVKAGADPDIDDNVQGLKPLHEAAKENHAEAVRALLEAKVNPLTEKTRENPGRRCGNAPRTMGRTALMDACRNGHLEALDSFMPFLTDIDTIHRALLWSAEEGHSRLVRRILQHPGVDINAKVRGDTALYVACSRGCSRDTIVTLIEAGADPKIFCDDSGPEFGGMRYITSMYSNKDDEGARGYTALSALCGGSHGRYRNSEIKTENWPDLIDLLVQKGADVRQQAPDGNTALHMALGNPTLVRLLLAAGADANSTNRHGSVPMHSVSNIDSLTLLVEEGQADINKICMRDQRSPLLCMLRNSSSDPQIISKLLEYGPDITIKDKEGNGPLHLLLKQSRTELSTLTALLAVGADPNERNRAGQTPLLAMQSRFESSTETVDILLKAGADINARSHTGKTLLTTANLNEISGLIEKGADIGVRDYRGRTLLHHAIASHKGTKSSVTLSRPNGNHRFDVLLGLDMDVKAVDYRGNTLMHELASRRDVLDSYSGQNLLPLWRQLLQLGLSPGQGNNEGRTTLHFLAATQPCERGAFTTNPGQFGAADLIIAEIKRLDQRDSQGVTPLHLAATVSEYFVKKLLDAGADPTMATFEGLTPLHLAARARQSNIVGLLLACFKPLGKGPIDASDEKGHTALYYACRSGRPETVRLLLDSGADASRKDLFEAVTAFEEEEKLWNTPRHPIDVQSNGCAGGFLIHDQTRPALPSYQQSNRSNINTHRLEEIIEMLIDNGADASGLSGSTQVWGHTAGFVDSSAHACHNYVLACLVQAQRRLPWNETAIMSRVTLFAKEATIIHREAQLQQVTQSKFVEKSASNQDLVERLLKQRQYHMMEHLFNQGVDFAAEDDTNSSNLSIFVENGFASLLDQIGTLEMERQFEKGKLHAFGDKAKSGLHTDMDLDMWNDSDQDHSFLLFKAIERHLPNMEVVRLLVEQFHVDVNQFRYDHSWLKNGQYELAPVETALHYVAKGKHWWHAGLALPYLISQGADVNIKGDAGRTPLHCALGMDDGYAAYVGTFHKDAATALMAAGADVNAVDEDGFDCLSYARYDTRMVQLLLEKGAIPKVDTLFAAIDGKYVEALRALLAAGADPNAVSTRKIDTPWATVEYEEHPLYAAAMDFHARHIGNLEEQRKMQELVLQLVEALLAHGADPYTTYTLPINSDDEEDEEDTYNVGNALALRKANTEIGSENVTILHALLEDDGLVYPMLTMPSFDPNCRDARGRTVLHAACHKRQGIHAPINVGSVLSFPEAESMAPSFLNHLLSRGADPLATDNEGRNFLHHMLMTKFGRQSSPPNPSTITRIAKDFPILINQADKSGKTPLYMAFRHAVLACDTAPAEALLHAGADPSTVDHEGNTALHILAYRVAESAPVRSLVTSVLLRGLDINARNSYNETPVFNLVKVIPKTLRTVTANDGERISPAEALTFFQDVGADPFAVDGQGRSLLHMVAEGDLHCLEAWFKELMGRGVDPMVEDGRKRTALDVAAACGKEKVLNLFEKHET